MAQPRQGLSGRAVLLGVVLLILNAYWIMDGLIWRQHRPTTVSLFVNVVFTMFWLVLLNAALLRLAPRFALRTGELVCIYALLSIGSAMCSLDFMQPLVSIIAHLKWFAGVSNNWDTLFMQHVPSWLMVNDKSALHGFYAGHSSLYLSDNYRPWLTPFFVWSGFIFVLVFAMICICVILRREWTEKARLSFPIAQTPYELVRNDQPIIRSKLFWCGFILAFVMNFVNGMHELHPTLPSFGGWRFDIGPLFTTRPFNAIGWTPLSILPFGVGLGFLIPLDLAFSCWFFYLFWKVERVIAAATGYWGVARRFPYLEEQQFGGYMGLCLAALWVSRRHLGQMVRQSLGFRAARLQGFTAAPVEPMSYPLAFWFFVLCFGALVFFSVRCGMSLWAAVLFFALYYMLSTGITRLRAELGSPVHDLHLGGPHLTMVYCLGTRILSPKDLTILSFYQFFNRAYRGHVMPHQLESFKLAEMLHTSPSAVLWAMVMGMVIGTLAGFWALLHVSYLYQGRAGYGNETFSRLASWLGQVQPFSIASTMAVLLGLGQAMLLAALRMRFPWFPLHPAGFAVSGNWSMNLFWLSIFFAWLIKRSLLSYAGLLSYRKALPFFIGLILGDYVMGSFWSIWGCATHRWAYNFLP